MLGASPCAWRRSCGTPWIPCSEYNLSTICRYVAKYGPTMKPPLDPYTDAQKAAKDYIANCCLNCVSPQYSMQPTDPAGEPACRVL